MNTVSYTLMELNRKVTVKHRGRKATMLLRDLLKITKALDCEVTEDNSLVVGPGIFLEVVA